MKSNQYSVKVFETNIEDEAQFISFIDANYELFKNHLISIKGFMSKDIIDYLNNKHLVFVNNLDLPRAKATKIPFVAPKQEEKVEEKHEKVQIKLKTQALKIIDKPLRSGQTIEHNGDILLLERVNSGAKVTAQGSIIALNLIGGDLVSNGEFIIIPESKKTNILFHGVMIDTVLLKYKLNKIALANNKITVESVSKKELTWV